MADTEALPSERSSPPPDGAEALHSATALSEKINMERWLRLMVILATLLLLALTIAVATRLLASIGHTLLVFSLGGLLAYALDPLVEFARRDTRGTGKLRTRTWSAIVVFVGLFSVLGLTGLLLSRTLVHQVETLTRDHALYEAQAHEKLGQADIWLSAHGIRLNLTDTLNNPPSNMRTWSESLARNLLMVLGHVTRFIVEGLIVVLIALYFLIYSEEMRSSVNRALPGHLLPYARQWQEDVNRILGGFVRGQLTLAVVIGTMAAVLCGALGLKFWLLIGLFVVVAALIPVVGPFIGAIPAVSAALLSPHAHFHPAVRVGILLLSFVIINEVGSKILYPRLVGAALGLHEVLVLFMLFAGYEVAGLTGVLFAAPLTALTILTVSQLYRLWLGLPPVSVSEAAQRGGQMAKARGIR